MCLGAFKWCLPSLLESSGVLLTFFCHLRQGDWCLFTWRHIALKRQNKKQRGMRTMKMQQIIKERKSGWLKTKWLSTHRTGLLFFMCGSPLFGRTLCCPSGGPEGISGCSVGYHYVARRMAVVMTHQTSETQVTDWSAELKQEQEQEHSADVN